ncbi:MAG: gamma-glutamyl-gamma-aminobutyrate hydrolase family protein [Syntrophaceae bacterium]|nr:gamma-glutamyl-gamma-aminobutyrate hydrolase family protein [Syntrophaceae bacterium]
MKPRIAITLELSIKNGRALSFLDLAYAQCVEEAGGMPFHLPPLSSPGFIPEALAMMDGLVLSGGADIHPSYYREEISSPAVLSPDQRTAFDLALLRGAMKANKSILAICHGMQIVNIAQGGTLYQDIPTQVPGAIEHRGKKDPTPASHGVTVEDGSKLAQMMGGMLQFEICSTHHQAVKSLGRNLRVIARAPDGVVEGIELSDHPKLVGVQWHPEKSPESEATRRLFRAFVESSCGR